MNFSKRFKLFLFAFIAQYLRSFKERKTNAIILLLKDPSFKSFVSLTDKIGLINYSLLAP